MQFRPLLIASSCLTLTAAAETDWRPLFNGRDLAGWSVTLQGHPPGEDPDRLVQVREGAIHIYPDSDPAATVPFGVITSDEVFSRFHLALEYRWLEKKFAPRKNEIRDAGLLYHVTGADKVWPTSIEYQIQEGDSGDLIFIETDGLTWAHPQPELAPAGQGDAGLLPENGGVLRKGVLQSGYIGRFPEHDHPGWNRVEIIVQGGGRAEHWLNGHVRARVGDFQHPGRSEALTRGKIALQLEGAELQYRHIEVRELDEPLRADRELVALSAVKDQPAVPATFTVRNPLERPLAAQLTITGKDAGAFSATTAPTALAGGASTTVTVHFKPDRGLGRYSAGLRIGTPEHGAFVILQGIGLAAFEGKNEPPLQEIVRALGMSLDVGGGGLELDTRAAAIGEGVAAARFVSAGTGKIRVTPLARFSPPGETPFGLVAGDGNRVELGRLADSSEMADAHQRLMPPLAGGAASVEVDAPAEPFALFMQGHHHTAFTDPALPTEAAIPHTARIYPVRHFLNRPLADAWLVGFEEAANGDYQDAVFLLENVKPAP